MSRSLEPLWKPDLRCDECGKLGAYDYYDYFCDECLAKSIARHEAAEAEKARAIDRIKDGDYEDVNDEE